MESFWVVLAVILSILEPSWPPRGAGRVKRVPMMSQMGPKWESRVRFGSPNGFQMGPRIHKKPVKKSMQNPIRLLMHSGNDFNELWCQNGVKIERKTIPNATWKRKGSTREFAIIYNGNQGFFRFRMLEFDEKSLKHVEK